jgi:outer membrane lipoprotein carrier protein
MSTIPTLLLSATLLAMGSAAQAQTSLLDQFARDVHGLEGRFDQRVVDSTGREVERSAGRVAIAAPRQFRWEYESPFPQLIVADGDRVWIYDPDLEQVTVRRQSDEEQSSPLAALIEPGALERQFRVETGPVEDGVHWLRLTPYADQSAFAQAELGLFNDELVEMHLTDTLGQRTEIAFSDWQRNPAFTARTFRFIPPPGVEVVGDVAPGAQSYPLDD